MRTPRLILPSRTAAATTASSDVYAGGGHPARGRGGAWRMIDDDLTGDDAEMAEPETSFPPLVSNPRSSDARTAGELQVRLEREGAAESSFADALRSRIDEVCPCVIGSTTLLYGLVSQTSLRSDGCGLQLANERAERERACLERRRLQKLVRKGCSNAEAAVHSILVCLFSSSRLRCARRLRGKTGDRSHYASACCITAGRRTC